MGWWLSWWDIFQMSVPAVTWPRGYLVLELPVGLVVVALGRWPDVGTGMTWASCRAGHRGAPGRRAGLGTGRLVLETPVCWWLSQWDINPMSVPAVTWPRGYLVLELRV
ncbi:hypothetical protein [Aeromonas veronii]|uniref:hypothetical protein n=1 Tax=Aeromonas veronii TaxID=654 RepID=UPI0039F6C302